MSKVLSSRNLKNVSVEDLLKADIYKVINLDGENTLSDWTVVGATVLSEERTSPIVSDVSLKYTQIATSAIGDKSTIATFPLPLQAQDATKHVVRIRYRVTNGTDSDFVVKVLGAGGSVLSTIPLSISKKYVEVVYTPLVADTSLSLQLEVGAVNSGAYLDLGSVEFSLNTPTICAGYNSNSGQAITTAETIVIYEDVVGDPQSFYNPTTGIGTLPKEGVFFLMATVSGIIDYASDTDFIEMLIYINNTLEGISKIQQTRFSADPFISISFEKYLYEGDTFSVRFISSVAGTVSTTSIYNRLCMKVG